MSTFTSKISYATQHEVYFDDGREIELLKYIFSLPAAKLDTLRNNPTGILTEIDHFASTKYLMNIGEHKGRIVTPLLTGHTQTVVELGGYIGYSTLLFSSHLHRVNPSAHYYTLESHPLFASITLALVALAGLSSFVTVVIGDSSASLRRLHAEGVLERVDVLFLDHYKPAYTPDLKLCESLGLVRGGTVVVADNVVKPGNPRYLQWVRAEREERERLMAGEEARGEEGRKELVYRSRMVESFEPTGVRDAVEVSVCVEDEGEEV